MATMRAKMVVSKVNTFYANQDGSGPVSGEQLYFTAVCAKDFGEGGTDENNTFARYTPTANLGMHISNPALFGKFKVGDTFYVDFTEAPK